MGLSVSIRYGVLVNRISVSKRDVSERVGVLINGIRCLILGMGCSFRGWGVCIWNGVLVNGIGC